VNSYTEAELREAAREHALILYSLLRELHKQYYPEKTSWTRKQLWDAACMKDVRSTMEAIMDDADRKKTGSMNEDSTLTVRELRRAVERMGFTDAHTGRILDKIASSREPGYPPGTIVKDKNELWYRRSAGGWEMFGTQVEFGFDVPARPLEVKS
jgi:hypothetical protein